MSDIAIKVENLSKRYRIGRKEEIHDTFAGAAADWIKRPGKNLRRLCRLTRFGENGHDPEDIIWALKDVSLHRRRMVTGFRPELSGRENIDTSVNSGQASAGCTRA